MLREAGGADPEPARPLGSERITIGLGLYTGQQAPGSEQPLYSDAIELAVAAEQVGFDAFWVSEHHGFTDSYLPAPLTLLGAIAARTSRLVLGTGVVVAPLMHPIRLAEEAAVVDQLSHGRLILGIGLGYAEHEYRSFGVDKRTRGAGLSDLVAFLRTAWQGQAFDWDGPCYRGTDLLVRPRPARPDGIPIWLGGYAPAAIHRAARLADGYLLGRADEPILADVSAQLTGLRDPGDSRFTLALNVLTILTEDAADEASARHAFAYQQSTYEAVQRGGIAHAGRVETATAPVSAATVDSYLHAYGTSAEVAAQIARKLDTLTDWAHVHVVIRALFPEPDLGLQLRRLDRLGNSVLPIVRGG